MEKRCAFWNYFSMLNIDNNPYSQVCWIGEYLSNYNLTMSVAAFFGGQFHAVLNVLLVILNNILQLWHSCLVWLTSQLSLINELKTFSSWISKSEIFWLDLLPFHSLLFCFWIMKMQISYIVIERDVFTCARIWSAFRHLFCRNAQVGMWCTNTIKSSRSQLYVLFQ